MFQKGTFSKSILVWEAFSTFLTSIYKITLYVLINQAHIRLMKKNKSEKTPEELCDPLLEAALNHVAFDGWSKRTLSQAEKDVGTVPGIIELAFPGGAIQMIDLHAQHCDIEMVKKAAKFDVNNYQGEHLNNWPTLKFYKRGVLIKTFDPKDATRKHRENPPLPQKKVEVLPAKI